MSFFKRIEQYAHVDLPTLFAEVTDADITRSLARDTPGPMDFLALLSPRAAGHLEAMAEKAHKLTVQQFGRTIHLFIPLYLANHCTNYCRYCGFNAGNAIPRNRLTIADFEKEAAAIKSTGMQHILILTGESRQATPLAYLKEAAACLKKSFASVAVEVYPLETEEYRELRAAGVDSMTVFQETYHQEVYLSVHPAGPKRDYQWRLNAPERAAQAGLRLVNIGPLLGLAEPRSEVFYTGLHGRYLKDTYLDCEVAVSLPRFNKAEGDFQPDYLVDDKSFVQFMLALRLFLPQAGLTISTRESAAFRDKILPLGATRYSAGSSTGVGGYANMAIKGTPQFEITDTRSVEAVAAAITALGYQPVYKDWDAIV